MSYLQETITTIGTVIFTFFSLLALMPDPRHANGDNRGYWAIIAALAAGVVVVAVA